MARGDRGGGGQGPRGRQRHAWNGPRYAVESFAVSRTDLAEDSEIHLTLRPADYFTFLAAQQLDRRRPNGGTLRDELDPDDPTRAPAYLSCSFGTNIAVVTRDERLMITRRSNRVRTGGGLWNSTVNEGLSRHIDSEGRNPPNLYSVARRGMREELGLEPSEYTLQMLAVAIDAGKHQWAAYFYARLTELDAEAMRARISRGVPDRWEHHTIDYVPFTPRAVTEYLLSPERRNHWAPCAPSLFHLALVHAHKRLPVERAQARVIRNLERRGGR